MKLKNFINKIVEVVLKDLTSFGSSLFYFIVIFFMLLTNEIFFSYFLFLNYIIITGIVIIVRKIYFKERPKKQKHSNILEKIDASSFPSIHAARITALFVSAILYLTINLKMLIFLLFVVILVLYSRLHFKKHYFIDVLFGIILAIITTLLLHFIL